MIKFQVQPDPLANEPSSELRRPLRWRADSGDSLCREPLPAQASLLHAGNTPTCVSANGRCVHELVGARMTFNVRRGFLKNTVCGMIAVLVAISQTSALAQQDGLGAIRGTIADESGAVLPSVTVTARNTETGLSRSALTDTQGDYEISSLDTGRYEVNGTLPGFRGQTTTVTVSEGESQLDLTLDIAPLAETVTVTRSEQTLASVPNAVALIQQDDLDFAQRKTSMDEAMRGIPGLFVQNRRNYGLSGGVGLSIRSPQPKFGLRGIAIIQDGIPITTADGTTEPSNVDLGSVRRVEVIRGPSSVLYGNSAGGVISLFTEIDPSRRLTLRPDIQVGSNGYNRQQLRVDGHNNSGTEFMGSFSRFETDGWRQHSAAEIRQTNIVVRQALSEGTRLSGVFNHYHSPFAENPSMMNEQNARNDPRGTRAIAVRQHWGEATEQGQYGVTLEHSFGTQMFRVTGWGVSRDLFASNPGRVIDLSRQGGGLRSEYLGTKGIVQWSMGLDVSLQSDTRKEFSNETTPEQGHLRGSLLIQQLEDVQSAGPFAQLSVTPHSRVTMTAGIRYDHYSFSATDQKLDDGDQSGKRTMKAASPSVGLTFTATPTLNLFTNFSTAYQTPTTVELSNRPEGEGGFNQLLEPEHVRSFEFGLRGLVEPVRLQYEVAVYRARLLNAFVSQEGSDEQTFFSNAGESSRNGVELSLNWQPVSRLRARVAYTHQNFLFQKFVASNGTDYSGNLEPGAPPNRFFAGVNYVAPFGLRSNASVRWVDDFFANNANTASNWAYTVVDLRFGLERQWGNNDVRPFLGIDNLFNERYNSSVIVNAWGKRYFEPSPDREFYFGITIGVGVR